MSDELRGLDAYITGHYGEDEFRPVRITYEEAAAVYRWHRGDILVNPPVDNLELFDAPEGSETFENWLGRQKDRVQLYEEEE